MHLKPIISNELVASDHTELLDAPTAGHGSTSKSDWANYRQTLRTFTSTMDPYDILATWPTKPNDGSTAYDQYFDSIADLIARTTARRSPVRVMHASALRINYRGGNDTFPYTLGDRFLYHPAERSNGRRRACRGRQVVIAIFGNECGIRFSVQTIVADRQPHHRLYMAMLTHFEPLMTAGMGYFLMSGKM